MENWHPYQPYYDPTTVQVQHTTNFFLKLAQLVVKLLGFGAAILLGFTATSLLVSNRQAGTLVCITILLAVAFHNLFIYTKQRIGILQQRNYWLWLLAHIVFLCITCLLPAWVAYILLEEYSGKLAAITALLCFILALNKYYLQKQNK